VTYTDAQALLMDPTLIAIVNQRMALAKSLYQALTTGEDVPMTNNCDLDVREEIKLHHDSAILSQQIYLEHNAVPPFGWEKLASSTDILIAAEDKQALTKTGYFAIAFVDRKNTVIAFSHRGTVINVSGNIIQDISITRLMNPLEGSSKYFLYLVTSRKIMAIS
jgi:hypothetical protein